MECGEFVAMAGWEWVLGVELLEYHKEGVGVFHGTFPYPVDGNMALGGNVLDGEFSGVAPGIVLVELEEGCHGDEVLGELGIEVRVVVFSIVKPVEDGINVGVLGITQ